MNEKNKREPWLNAAGFLRSFPVAIPPNAEAGRGSRGRNASSGADLQRGKRIEREREGEKRRLERKRGRYTGAVGPMMSL